MDLPRRSSWLAVVGLVLLASTATGCRDAGAERYAKAEARYQALLAERRSPKDPAFAELLAELELVPNESGKAAAAARLAQAIVAARAPRVEAPLATPSPRRLDDPEVSAREADCARLARALGVAEGPQRARLAREVEACRRSVSEKTEASHEARAP
jgi:hypothetical protein